MTQQQQNKNPGLRGGSRRVTSSPPPPRKERPVCSSIGCPDNYAPIANAGEVECEGGECTKEQCCEAMCACFACPENYTPIEEELYELCDGGECTKEQCCERGMRVRVRLFLGWTNRSAFFCFAFLSLLSSWTCRWYM